MNNEFYNLKPLVPYLLLYLLLFLILSISLIIIGNKKITSKNAGFYGLFLNLNNRKILSISFILTYLFVIIESIIINDLSYTHLVIFIILSCLCNIIVLNYKFLIVSLIYSFFIYYVLYFQKIFIDYTKDIDVLWYIVILIVAMSIFSLITLLIIVIKNLRSICFAEK